MKVFAAIALASIATASFAADRAIYDLQYLPNAGTTYGITEVGALKGKIEVKNVDYNVKFEGWRVQQTIGHSITDRLLVNATGNFSHFDTKTNFAGTKTTDSTKGFSDPTVGARFRAMDEALRLDFTGDVTIKTSDSLTNGHRSNNRQGSNSLRLGAELGQKTESMQLVGIAQLNHFFKGTSKTDSDKTKSDGYNEFVFGGAGLVKVLESTFVKGLANVTFADEYDTHDDIGDDTTSSSTLYTVGAELQQAISKDLLVRGGVNWINGHSSGIESYNLYTFVVGANYQF